MDKSNIKYLKEAIESTSNDIEVLNDIRQVIDNNPDHGDGLSKTAVNVTGTVVNAIRKRVGMDETVISKNSGPSEISDSINETIARASKAISKAKDIALEEMYTILEIK